MTFYWYSLFWELPSDQLTASICIHSGSELQKTVRSVFKVRNISALQLSGGHGTFCVIHKDTHTHTHTVIMAGSSGLGVQGPLFTGWETESQRPEDGSTVTRLCSSSTGTDSRLLIHRHILWMFPEHAFWLFVVLSYAKHSASLLTSIRLSVLSVALRQCPAQFQVMFRRGATRPRALSSYLTAS